MRGLVPKALEVDALIPADDGAVSLVGTDRPPRCCPRWSSAIEEGESALVFTNTRATAEIWYQALLAARPDWAGIIALHHGSLDRATREWVEDGLREGRLRCVVCTSTLDLGVDFTPVDRVLQVGSPKAVGRLIQRAGRSGHQPGAVEPAHVRARRTRSSSSMWPPPRDALAAGRSRRAARSSARSISSRSTRSPSPSAGASCRTSCCREVRTTHAYRDLTDDEWPWVLDFITHGGTPSSSYPEYSKVVVEDGRYRRHAAGWWPCGIGSRSAPS